MSGKAKFCGNCGNQLTTGAKFCGECGSPISANQEEVQVNVDDNKISNVDESLLSEVDTRIKPIYGLKFDLQTDCENCGSRLGSAMKCKVCGFEYELA